MFRKKAIPSKKVQMRREVDTVKEVFAEKSAKLISHQMERALLRHRKSNITSRKIIDEFQLALDTHLIDLMPINEKAKSLAKEVLTHNSNYLGHAKTKTGLFTQEEAIRVFEKGINYLDKLNEEKLRELKFDAPGFREILKDHLRTIKGSRKPFLNMNKKVLDVLVRINAALLRQTLGERMSVVLRELSLDAIEELRLQLNKEVTG
jgi:hypothetical protein